jgi:hypothetical protein
MDNSEKILQTIRIKGPVVPADIIKVTNTNLLFASAMLSELVAHSKLAISHLKIGGSPLYYIKGQENRLQNFSSKLPEKEKRAYDILSEKKILRDKDIEPLYRVALRQIKDFAVPLQVNLEQGPEIYWKWYLLADAEAEALIKDLLNPPVQLEKKSELKKEQIPDVSITTKEEKPIIHVEETIKIEEKKETHKDVKQDVQKPVEPKKFIDKGDSFYNQVKKFFDKNSIIIISEDLKKKKTDFEFIVELSTSVGTVQFFCKAKNKKSINEQELALASIQGQTKKLPVIFLTPGTLTKKAKDMLAKEFKGLTIKSI